MNTAQPDRPTRCTTCRTPLAGTAWALVTERPAALIDRHANVTRFTATTVKHYCDPCWTIREATA